MIAYKLLHVRRDGTLGSLFINKRAVLPIGRWLQAASFPTKGYGLRPGWHATHLPLAPHLSMTGRRWYLVYIDDVVPHPRDLRQGGLWFTADWIKIVRPVEEDEKLSLLHRGMVDRAAQLSRSAPHGAGNPPAVRAGGDRGQEAPRGDLRRRRHSPPAGTRA